MTGFECSAAIVSDKFSIISSIIPLQIIFFLHNYHNEFQSVLNDIINRIIQDHTGLFSKSKRGNCLYISLGTKFIGTQTGVWQMQGNMRMVCRD